ncbi:MAG: SsrA-binding protein SmpB [Alphaproteobacteria bacterium]
MSKQIIAQNRKARHDYFIEDTMEAGLILRGTEVKALRDGRASIGESYVDERAGSLWLTGAHISEYTQANRFNHEPTRPREILLKKRQLTKLLGQIQAKGITLVPLTLYFNERGIAKCEIALVKGKKQHDKRQSEKDRDWSRQKSRLMRDYG